MNAKKILKLYERGERDFRGENLRGLSFKGKDLSGADFSLTDIRGTNFSRANLTGCKFTKAKAGLPDIYKQSYLLAAYSLLVLLSAFEPHNLGGIALNLFSLKNEICFSVWISLFIILWFNFLLFSRGLKAGIVTIASIFTGVITGAIAFALLGAFFVEGFSIVGAIVGAIAFVGAVAFVGSVAFAVAVAFVGAIDGAVAGAFTEAVAFSFILIFILIVLYSYLGWRTIKGDPRDEWVRTFAVAFAATGGTNFYGANLTDVDFNNAILRNTSFRKAILTRTCFKETQKLYLVQPDNTYIGNLYVQQLLITGQGDKKDFSGLNLQGINLQGANLIDASFMGTNLSHADLRGANLSGAKLVKAQLDETDFTGATLTGAYIEDWGITRSTKFDEVNCGLHEAYHRRKSRPISETRQ